MSFNIRARQLVSEQEVCRCEKCQKVYESDNNFCPTCGSKLLKETLKVYANFGKNGITSYTYKLPGGISFNTKKGMTISLAKGISYTSK